MKHLSLAALTLAMLAGCGSYQSSGSSMSSSGYGPGAPGPVTTTSSAASGAPVMKNGMLVNAKGLTLYTFDRDVAASGKSVCNDKCSTAWPPLMAGASDRAGGDYSIITRDDGKKQWAYKGKPLYQWPEDQEPGDKFGDNYNKVWHIVTQ
jgi:predicted lipoprotein with Yx(FWY)xxD motif